MRFIKLIYKEYKTPKYLEIYLNIGFLIISSILKNTPGLKADNISGINGSISCFFIVYLIPLFLHMKCYYWNKNELILDYSVISSNNNNSLINQMDVSTDISCVHDSN